ncbi:EamA family transporter [Streptomyces sp. NPDC004533]|uniref:EamA family transporter n=1 Tax=Streptomyces sp. NPDC004533 TaxID=3154278 RepID=UPI0033B70585
MKSRLDPLSMAAMAVTVVSVSATAPLTAAASASPLAMAFWRNCLGFAALGPLLLILRRREVVRVARGERGILRREQWRPLVFGFLAATALALHFAAFMTSTRLTSVAMSTALVATQPVWQTLIAAGQGGRTRPAGPGRVSRSPWWERPRRAVSTSGPAVRRCWGTCSPSSGLSPRPGTPR